MSALIKLSARHTKTHRPGMRKKNLGFERKIKNSLHFCPFLCADVRVDVRKRGGREGEKGEIKIAL